MLLKVSDTGWDRATILLRAFTLRGNGNCSGYGGFARGVQQAPARTKALSQQATPPTAPTY